MAWCWEKKKKLVWQNIAEVKDVDSCMEDLWPAGYITYWSCRTNYTLWNIWLIEHHAGSLIAKANPLKTLFTIYHQTSDIKKISKLECFSSHSDICSHNCGQACPSLYNYVCGSEFSPVPPGAYLGTYFSSLWPLRSHSINCASAGPFFRILVILPLNLGPDCTGINRILLA